MRSLYPKKINKYSKLMLFPVDEEYGINVNYDLKAHSKTFRKAHQSIISMTIDQNVHAGSYYMSTQKLKRIIDDIIYLKRLIAKANDHKE